MALNNRRFWLLTAREFNAHKKRYNASRGIKPAPTWRERREEAKASPRIVHASNLEEARAQLHRQRCEPTTNRRRRRPVNA